MQTNHSPSITIAGPSYSRPVAGHLLGIWRLTELLHVGTWTDLFRAQPADAMGSPRSDYVVKVARSGKNQDAAVAANQIRAEVMLSSKARQPNLISVLDYALETARPYVVMPYLDGCNLQMLVDRQQWVQLPVALWWTRQCAQALAALHRVGWRHCDVKPANLIVSPRGHLTLCDLGLATPFIGLNVSDEVFRGTPQYAAPETRGGEAPIHGASDVYSLGVVLWQLKHQCATLPASPTDIDFKPDLSDPIDELLASMLQVDPSARPTASLLADRLLRLEIESLGSYIRPAAA